MGVWLLGFDAARFVELLVAAERLVPLTEDFPPPLAARVDDVPRDEELFRAPVALRVLPDRELLPAERPVVAEREPLPRDDPRDELVLPLLVLLRVVLLLPLRDELLRADVPRRDLPPLVAIDDSPPSRWNLPA